MAAGGALLPLFFLLELVGFERRIDFDLLNLDLFSKLAAGMPGEAVWQSEAIDVAVVSLHPQRA
jgi:hypothetical protein